MRIRTYLVVSSMLESPSRKLLIKLLSTSHSVRIHGQKFSENRVLAKNRFLHTRNSGPISRVETKLWVWTPPYANVRV